MQTVGCSRQNSFSPALAPCSDLSCLPGVRVREPKQILKNNSREHPDD